MTKFHLKESDLVLYSVSNCVYLVNGQAMCVVLWARYALLFNYAGHYTHSNSHGAYTHGVTSNIFSTFLVILDFLPFDNFDMSLCRCIFFPRRYY